MLETAERIEAPTETSSTDAADLVPSPTGAPPTEATGRGRLGRILIGCLVIEAAVMTIALLSLVGDRATPPPPAENIADLDEAAVTATVDATESFLDAWARSLEENHRATGTVTRVALGRDALFTSAWPETNIEAGGPTAAVLPYRHSRLDGYALNQVGDAATIVDPIAGRRTCLRRTQTFACTVEGEPADADSALVAVEQAVVGPTATHRIVAVDPIEVLIDHPQLPADISCWEARSVTDGLDQRWGRRAQFCFHQPTGAAVFRRLLGTTRVEVLVVDTVSSSVSPADLDPV